jgi:hypothetical protein
MEALLKRLAANDHPCGVVAHLYGESGPADLDGNQWSFLITDGMDRATVNMRLIGSEGGARGMEIPSRALEAALESKAGSFPAEARLSVMAARGQGDGHIQIHWDEIETAQANLNRPVGLDAFTA